MPRIDRRIPYRWPLEPHESGVGGVGLYFEFIRAYLLPCRWMLACTMLLASLNASSIYLQAYYGRVVVDEILHVSPPEATSAVRPGPASVAAGDLRPPARRPPRHGIRSEAVQAQAVAARPPRPLQRLLAMFALYALTLCVLNVAARVSDRLMIRLSKHITGKLREDLHGKILALSRRYHQQHSPGRLMARILSDVNIVQTLLLSTAVTAVSHGLMFLAGLTILFLLEWPIAVLVCLVMIPYVCATLRTRRAIRAVNQELRHTNACLWAFISQKLDAVRAILAYGRERHETLNLRRLLSCFARDSIQQQRLGALRNRAVQIITSVATIGIFLLCTRRVLDGSMTLGKMMYIYGAAASLFTPVLGLTQMSLQVSSLLVVLRRLGQILDEPQEIRECAQPAAFPVPLRSGIRLRHLVFSYAGETEPVLREISLDVPAGQWLCVMGPSGGGKSTLLHLLTRLYDPTAGEILIDGTPLSRFSLRSLRRHMALVPQEAQIFSGTVRDNIVYGNPDVSPAAIMAAAQAAECHDFIMEMPVQYETTIGEKGVSLSGGQKQRISMARALLSDPEVLLLDDCTSALDASTEQRIQETLARLLQNKTAVMVSQRVSMAMRCHRICVLSAGTIAEYGTHAELLDNGGFYARLCRQQVGPASGPA